MRHVVLVLLISLRAFAAAAGAPAIGSVVSPGEIHITGVNIKADGVLTWSIFAGDRLDVLMAPALLTLNEGARLILLPGSTVRVEAFPRLTVVILTGTVYGTCEPRCHTRIEADQHLIELPSQKAACVSLKGTAVRIGSGVVMPVFLFPRSWLLRIFPYQTGIHRPEDQP